MHHWLIQDTSRKDYLIQQEVDALNKIGSSFRSFGNPFFTKELTGLEQCLTDVNDTFCLRGSVKMIRLIHEIERVSDLHYEPNEFLDQFLPHLKNGLFYDEHAFDQTSMAHLPMLNSDRVIVQFKEIVDQVVDTDTFIKPSSDLKAFPAIVVEAGSTLSSILAGITHETINPNEYVLMSSCKNVYHEFRFFVVNGKVITGSQYRVDNQTKYVELNNSTLHQQAIGFANEVADLHKPAPVFTLDIGIHEHGISIVEYNCFNASGLYASDIPKLFRVVEDTMYGDKL